MSRDPYHAQSFDQTYQEADAGAPRHLIDGKLGGLANFLRTWVQRSRQRRALAELDDRLLRDIGLTPSQAEREAAKPFWCAGKA